MSKKYSSKPPKILFLYEGDTEWEFYRLILKAKIPKGTAIHKVNLHGHLRRHNRGVANILTDYLHKHPDEESIHVFIAYDREGPAGTELSINIELLRRDFVQEGITSIDEIVATQDLESWLFLDIDSIYSFLRTKKSLRAAHKYKNHQSFNNKDLAALFYQHGKEYQKGVNAAEFIAQLDLEKIYKACHELREGIELLLSKCK